MGSGAGPMPVRGAAPVGMRRDSPPQSFDPRPLPSAERAQEPRGGYHQSPSKPSYQEDLRQARGLGAPAVNSRPASGGGGGGGDPAQARDGRDAYAANNKMSSQQLGKPDPRFDPRRSDPRATLATQPIDRRPPSMSAHPNPNPKPTPTQQSPQQPRQQQPRQQQPAPQQQQQQRPGHQPPPQQQPSQATADAGMAQGDGSNKTIVDALQALLSSLGPKPNGAPDGPPQQQQPSRQLPPPQQSMPQPGTGAPQPMGTSRPQQMPVAGGGYYNAPAPVPAPYGGAPAPYQQAPTAPLPNQPPMDNRFGAPPPRYSQAPYMAPGPAPAPQMGGAAYGAPPAPQGYGQGAPPQQGGYMQGGPLMQQPQQPPPMQPAYQPPPRY